MWGDDMPKRASGLTARKVETLRRPAAHAHGHGLYLVVKPSWQNPRYCSSILLTAAAVRRGSAVIQQCLWQRHGSDLAASRGAFDGQGPSGQSRAAKAFQHSGIADDYISAHASSWRNAKRGPSGL